jgi:predicted RNA-binding protein YlxR (DUF448 family)
MKSDLLRVVAVTDGLSKALVPDAHATAGGRGAHLHPTIACLDLAERRRAFPRALRLEGPLDASALRAWLENRNDQVSPGGLTNRRKRSSGS